MNETFLAYEKSQMGDQVERVVAESRDLAFDVDQRNHWFEPGEIDDQRLQHMMKVAARGLYEVFSYCFQGQSLDNDRDLRVAVRRFVAVAWLIQPGLLKDSAGKCMTLEELASLSFLDCTKCSLSLKAQAFGKRWGFVASIQKRKTSKANYAEGAKRGWEKRRHALKILRQEARQSNLVNGAAPNNYNYVSKNRSRPRKKK